MKNRRCRNRAPHEAHVWSGLNTRGDGYQCAGIAAPPDLMQMLKNSLAAHGMTTDDIVIGGVSSKTEPSA